MSSEQIRYERELDEWRNLVGRAILGFGELEFITVKCLLYIPCDKIANTASRLGFAQRVDLLVEIIEGKSKEPSCSDLVAKLKKAKALTEVRNVLAHNPLLLNFYVHQSTGDVVMQRAIEAVRSKKKSIDLASLKELVSEIEDLSSELYLDPGLKALQALKSS